jgi:hypothetical protein
VIRPRAQRQRDPRRRPAAARERRPPAAERPQDRLASRPGEPRRERAALGEQLGLGALDRDGLDPHPVGQLGDDPIGEPRRARRDALGLVERAARLGDERRAARRLRGLLVQPRALQRLRALRRARLEERALVLLERALGGEAERDDAPHPVGADERQHGERGRLGKPRRRRALVPDPLEERRLARADRARDGRAGVDPAPAPCLLGAVAPARRADDVELSRLGVGEREQRPVGARDRHQLVDDRATDRRRVDRRREQRGHALEPLDALARRPLVLAGAQQLALVAAPVGRVEDRRAHEPRRAVVVGREHGVHEHRQAPPVGAHDVERDLADRALHPQQRRVVGLVVDPPAGGQQVLEAPLADELLARVAGPGEEGPVDPADRAVGERREVAARSVLVELLGVLLRGDRGRLGDLRARRQAPRGRP